MPEPTMEICFPYDEQVDLSACTQCGCGVYIAYWQRHVDWHHDIWQLLQAATQS